MTNKNKILRRVSILMLLLTVVVSIILLFSPVKLNSGGLTKIKSGSSIFIGPGPIYEDGCDCTYWDNECFCIIKR